MLLARLRLEEMNLLRRITTYLEALRTVENSVRRWVRR
jgi:hypothetical protein